MHFTVENVLNNVQHPLTESIRRASTQILWYLDSWKRQSLFYFHRRYLLAEYLRALHRYTHTSGLPRREGWVMRPAKSTKLYNLWKRKSWSNSNKVYCGRHGDPSWKPGLRAPVPACIVEASSGKWYVVRVICLLHVPALVIAYPALSSLLFHLNMHG